MKNQNKKMDLSIGDGKEYVRKKLERDYNKLSESARMLLQERYKKIIELLFVWFKEGKWKVAKRK